MRASLFLAGFMLFSFGIMFVLPTIIMNASSEAINTKTEALTFFAGHVIKEVSTINAKDESMPSTLIGVIPALLVLVGLILMALAFILRF